jgi:uncharacterized membrane protein (GlpM family)
VEYIIRFVIGGVVVSLFAVCGDIVKPKSFAGLFSAAPSVALATLAITASRRGMGYVSAEGGSMIIGAIAMFVYCLVTASLLMRYRANPLLTTGAGIAIWLLIVFGIYTAAEKALIV